MQKVYRFFKKKYELLLFKKYTTIAGTLVFFLIMPIVPLTFLLTLLIGKLPIDFERLLTLSIFDSVKNILQYVKTEAEAATASVSVILIFTTLYSSTNLFYQMRKSGEIIYDYHRRLPGLKTRLGALILLVIVMAILIAFLLLVAFGSFVFAKFLPGIWEKVVDYVLLATLSFLLVLLLTMYICPYKKQMYFFLPGTILTVGLWFFAVIGFSLYIKISNVKKLYGALSTIIVFLLWLYILMICFIKNSTSFFESGYSLFLLFIDLYYQLLL